ncbi:hypothetical protein [Lactobacillus terrae]|uniref:hypothetical protein n=1 Tax=Lactobacillus terrae TaxID=2269374 RepID=UPI000C1B7029|nr:hypothetical protein [Lactobacillus terrae]
MFNRGRKRRLLNKEAQRIVAQMLREVNDDKYVDIKQELLEAYNYLVKEHADPEDIIKGLAKDLYSNAVKDQYTFSRPFEINLQRLTELVK